MLVQNSPELVQDWLGIGPNTSSTLLGHFLENILFQTKLTIHDMLACRHFVSNSGSNLSKYTLRTPWLGYGPMGPGPWARAPKKGLPHLPHTSSQIPHPQPFFLGQGPGPWAHIPGKVSQAYISSDSAHIDFTAGLQPSAEFQF